MAAKGTVEQTVTRKGNMIRVRWYWTADENGDVDENGTGSGEFWFNPSSIPLFLVGVNIIYLSATNGYDVYVKTHYGQDILKGMGVGLADDAGDPSNMFCPVNTSQDIGTATNAAGTPICIWDKTLEIVVDDAGNGAHGYVELYFMLPSNRDM